MEGTKMIYSMGTCSYGDMVVSTLWWHLFMLIPLPIWMKGHNMRWPWNGTRWIQNSRHNVTQDSNFTWWPLRATWYIGRLDARSGQFDARFGSYSYADDQDHKSRMEFFKRFNGNKNLRLETFWLHQNTIDEQEDLTIDGYLYLASLLTLRENYFDAWRHDRVSTQWLSWTHVPIVSRGHYQCKIIRMQDYSRFAGTLARSEMSEMNVRVKSEMLWWFCFDDFDFWSRINV